MKRSVYFDTGTDTNLHFPSDGFGGFTTSRMAASAANYTKSGATVTGGGNVGAVADTPGYAFTQDGFYAPYIVVTAGVNGVIAVDHWRHPDREKLGRVPANGQTLTLHTATLLGRYQGVQLERVSIFKAGTGATLSLTSPNGTVLRVITIPNLATAMPNAVEIDELWKGPLGFVLSASGQVAGEIVFRPLDLTPPVYVGI